MLELTHEECFELERRVTEKIHQENQSKSEKPDLYEMIFKVATRATIATIREYERMKNDEKSDPQAQMQSPSQEG
ncbi:hypothetical protein [uncultured Oscillibacter sp.]|uniref:hypothetical protein n=1 Tax=uncultured Oscillibacter sp. TaxID=876091 RepID=UPI0025F07AD9|nr:hypothetical protein [uncultured Oscillibacter sp.]